MSPELQAKLVEIREHVNKHDADIKAIQRVQELVAQSGKRGGFTPMPRPVLAIEADVRELLEIWEDTQS